MSLLNVDNITVRYGRLTALRNFSLSMEQGETLFVTGPNGAGKSTLLKAIAGVVAPAEGRIGFQGQKVDGNPPENIARLGLSMVPEGRHVFGALSIEENLILGAGMRKNPAQAKKTLAEVYEMFPVLAERKDSHAGVLSGGQQQMLVIGRALMTEPQLVAIDEPSLGLAPKIIDQVYETLTRLRDERGLSLLIVEQSTTRAVMAGGRMVMLRSGEKVLEGDARELSKGDALNAAYFGFEEH
ncbi:ABC transporter ATP-binding protein [Roseovarius faecimaris]|uniref:ABC transporter ATP-binding protein n=1 Tax=Roseovarius faecimaris TaxID=2494550 RepID=A0A6I6IWR1_9RHOB|nr:ABC transporter ATP-binding protein [Roseovarius faecimaris]QGX97078.1 ABC transporter ATP-binding protein [Roseovarius faecimaris]